MNFNEILKIITIEFAKELFKIIVMQIESVIIQEIINY